MSRYLVPLLLGMALNLLAHQYGLSDEIKSEFPGTGHVEPQVHPNRAAVAPRENEGEACVVTQLGDAPPVRSCQPSTLPPLVRPPIGTVMDGPGLK